MWFGHVRRLTVAPVKGKKKDQMEDKSTKRGGGRLKKTLGEPLNNIYLNEFPETSVFDKAQWHHLMHVAYPT